MGSPIALPEIFRQGMQNFVIPEMVVAPFTSIVNRARVSASLKAIAGVERIMVKGLNLLQNEFGPAGERVFEAENKDARIRFVGTVTQSSGADGSYFAIAQNSYVEIAIYGTGLNILAYISGTTRDLKVSADGGSEGSNIIPVGSASISSRGYAAGTIISASSGLTLGWHTIKLRNNGSADIVGWGFEILNQRTDIAVLPGKAIADGSPVGLSALANSSFKAGVVGTRGARVVKYIENGALKQAVQEVNAAAAYLNSADHTNEEVVRRINFKEFGVNRADDFTNISTGGDANHAFTLDDGTTTLVSIFTRLRADGLSFTISSAGGSLSLTFTGTGLDLVRRESHALTLAGTSLVVDGATVSAVPWVGSNNASVLVKLCSGLTYGTHTIKLARLSGNEMDFQDFIIYQPKKPAIPAGTFEVADYNVMADYVGTFDVTIADSNAVGVLAKASIREGMYIGANWAVQVVSSAHSKFGFHTSPLANNSQPVEYPFFGSGVIVEVENNGVGMNIYIDGVLNASGAVSGATNNGGGLYTGAGVWSRIAFTGLSLTTGHKVRVERIGAGGGFLRFAGIYVITPIHINEPSLKIGSNSLRSNQNYVVMKQAQDFRPDLGKAKAWVVFDSVNSRIVSSLNVSAVLTVSTGSYQVYFEKPFKSSAYLGVAIGENSREIALVPLLANSAKISFFSVGTATPGGPNSLVYALFFGELIDE